jgi:L-Ala-D/L-Glu epimerase
MTYSLDDFFLEFNTPFTIAHGTRLGTDIVILKIVHQNITAFGEASLPPYLNEDAHSVKRFVKSFFELHSDLCVDLKESLLKLHTHEPENFSAKACIDIALHNWFAASAGIPVWQLIGLSNNPLPFCTFTIGIDSENVIRKKIEEAEDFKILKVKMGVPDEKDFLKTIRKYTGKPVCVDANQGWKDKEEALEMLLWLEQLNVVFVEQPMPKENTVDQQWLFERSPLPLYADESVQTAGDIHNIKDRFQRDKY